MTRKMIALGSLLATCAIAGPVFAADPQVFGSGVISGPANEASPVFTPDGKTLYFTRSNSSDNVLLVSHRQGDAWAQPGIAPFSGRWRDLEAAMAPDGSYLIFASSRPLPDTGKQPDGFWGGTVHVGRGGNLWRVDKTVDGWSTPKHLPDVINRNGSTFGPSITADGDLYFTDVYGDSKRAHLFYAAHGKDGGYQPPQPMPFTDARWSDVDETVAPDGSFMVFSSTRPPTPPQQMDLFIVFRKDGKWCKPQHLPDSINRLAGIIEARLGPDGHTLYFTSSYEQPVSYPKDPAAAAASLRDMVWNDGNYNIWQVDISDILKAGAAGGQ